MKRTNLIILLALIAAIVAGVLAAVLLPGNQSVAELLELGSRYLDELDWESAIASFERILKIDPKNVEAYLGLYEAYEQLGRRDEGARILREGFELTGDERMRMILDELDFLASASTPETDAPETEVTAAPDESSEESPDFEIIPGLAPEVDASLTPGGSSVEGLLTFEEFRRAENYTVVTVETYVQAKQSYWNGRATFYTQDEHGGFFLYEMECSEEEYAALVPGTKIRVTGQKTEWAGLVELINCTFEILPGNYVASPLQLSFSRGLETLYMCQSMFAGFEELTVVPIEDTSGNEHAFLYKWDGSGARGDDIYFNLTDGNVVMQFTVESYLCGADSAVYQSAEALSVGDVIDVLGFVYWYEGFLMHVTDIS